jgi:hypothetical protein
VEDTWLARREHVAWHVGVAGVDVEAALPTDVAVASAPPDVKPLGQ